MMAQCTALTQLKSVYGVFMVSYGVLQATCKDLKTVRIEHTESVVLSLLNPRPSEF